MGATYVFCNEQRPTAQNEAHSDWQGSGLHLSFLENCISAKTALALTAGNSSHRQTDTVAVFVPFTTGKHQTQHKSCFNSD